MITYTVMATGADVRDILELGGGENDGPISKKDLINSDKVRKKIPILIPGPNSSPLSAQVSIFK